MPDTEPIKHSAIVVAHPDDEVLWFSSLLPKVERVVFAFCDFAPVPERGARRRAAMRELPYAVSCLGLPEAESYRLANWEHPQIKASGLRLDFSGQSGAAGRYEENFDRLREILRGELRGASQVFTHNPWGEYGHEDHVQVNRATTSLAEELGFKIRVSCYVSRRSGPLAERYRMSDGSARSMTCRIDPAYADAVADIYRRHGCWTWPDPWTWPKEERFIASPILLRPAGPPLTPLPPLNPVNAPP